MKVKRYLISSKHFTFIQNTLFNYYTAERDTIDTKCDKITLKPHYKTRCYAYAKLHTK